MTVFILIFFILYGSLLGAIAFIGFFKQKRKENEYQRGERIDLCEITVLIPFRNEEHRILALLDSINTSNVLPKNFVFIDDHSSDNTIELIHQQLKNVTYQVVSLSKELTGKKKALRFAIEQVETEYVLTIDADVFFESNYFESISKLEKSEMYILPAIMVAKKPFEYLYEVDLILVNALNAGLAGILRPIICSGANLLYKKETFDEVDDFSSHGHMASGDDTYLLRDFRENGKEVRLISDAKFAIKTETPQSFREFIDQRLRWIGKTGDLKDNLSSSLAVLQTILTFTFFLALIYTASKSDWRNLAILLGVKTVIDMFIFSPYFFRIKRKITWAVIPIYELLFPIYSLLILLLVFVYKPTWKGRQIYARK